MVAAILFQLIAFPVVAQEKETKKEASYDLRKLALPSEIGNITKASGSIYYSPSVKGKVLIPVHFWGTIQKTGLHFIPIDTNLVNAISFAGGPASQAIMEDVRVTRKVGNKLVTKSFDLSEGGETDAYNYVLKPEDTVFVEKDNFMANRTYYT